MMNNEVVSNLQPSTSKPPTSKPPMNVFVINSGSSSIKYQLIAMPEAKVICSGLVDRIGLEGSEITHKAFLDSGMVKKNECMPILDHSEGLRLVASFLTD